MPPKLTNAFMEFVKEWRQNNSGGVPMSLPEAVNNCSDTWKVMTREQRIPYIEKANIANVHLRGLRNQRLVQMDRAQREAEEHLEMMKRETETMVVEAVKANDLENKIFTFVSFNYFTKTASGDLYVPAEFSACQFNLKYGILSEYHTLINPGSLDLGQAGDALHHSSTTHNLPLPPNALGESDMTKLYGEIHDYLSSSSRDSEPIVVFTKAEDMAKVKAFEGRDIFVRAMDHLLYVLKKQALQLAGLPIDDITELGISAYLRQDSFEYLKSIACQYHEDIDRSKYCTQSRIRRWVFSFGRLLCEDLLISKTPDKHIPRVENSGSDPENNNESSKEIHPQCRSQAGFGRGRARGRSTLGEANL